MSQDSQGSLIDDIAGGGATSSDRAEAPLATVRLSSAHRIQDFACASDSVTRFLREKAARWVKRRYCGVFVWADPSDPTAILGFYTISQYMLQRDQMRHKDKSAALQKDIPLVLIGYMGKNNGAPKGVGAALLIDAARRAYRSLDIPAVGLAVEPEGGRENKKLWDWYERSGFIPAKTIDRLMYGTYEAFIPELTE